MIKKHLITCSAMLVMLLVTKMFIYSSPVNPLATLKYNRKAPKVEVSKAQYFNTLQFAHEGLPVGDERVKWKMKRSLKAVGYQHLQTNILHRKAAQYFPLIEPILEHYGIPDDFKYIPLVESGLKSGTSPKGASGHWQFMPQTARDFGLRVDSNVDERQMIRKSTIAASKYLRSLYREFGSWTLAAAAYNIGEGSLKRQMRRQNEDNYYKMHLNRETAAYVYKLISMKEIIENPKLYGYNGKTARLLAKTSAQPEKAHPYFNPVAPQPTLLIKTVKN